MTAPPSPTVTLDQADAIGRLDAHDQATLLQTGEVSRLELVDAAILRIVAHDSTLNAVCYRDFDRARDRATSWPAGRGLAGVPYLLKDSLDYPGTPSRCGSRLRADAPALDVEYDYSRRLDASGLIPVGKSNMPEFAMLPTTESLLYGPSLNPWDLAVSPGGSSGGAGAAVAAGLVPLAHAADGGGSIRIPAACCGVVGLKPGRGRNVRARANHLVEDLLVGDTLLSRSVRDVAWATGLTTPTPEPGIGSGAVRPLRIALIMENLEGAAPHPAVAATIEETARLCEALGHHVETVAPRYEGPAVTRAFKTLWGQLGRELVAQLGPAAADLEPWTRDLGAWGLRATPDDLEQIVTAGVGASQAMASFFETWDLILSPVLNSPPVPLGHLAPTRPIEHLLRDMFDYVSYTPLHNMTGLPAISLPVVHGPGKAPIGSMFAAARGGEGLLLELAAQLEAAYPWAGRQPAARY